MSIPKLSSVAELNFPETGEQPTPKLLEIGQQTFRAKFNREPFFIGHHLTDHPLFKLPELFELSKRLNEDVVEYYAGNVPVSIDSRVQPRNGLSIQETIRRIEECGSWMVMKCVHHDSVYGELLDQCLDEIRPLSEPLDPGMCARAAAVFFASPGSVTPYHMDHEINFLLQIRGTKQISIFDQTDRSVLPEEEFEKYFTGDRIHRNMKFKEEWQQKASVFELTPGTGVHIPAHAPHWVKNGNGVSISMAIYFLTAASDRIDCVSQSNAHLRKLGFNPMPFGQSPLRDSVKHHAFRAFRRAWHR
jgi:cupin-like protein